MSNTRTDSERLDAIEGHMATQSMNIALLVEGMRAIATELGIREQVRGVMRQLDDANGHDTEPAPPPAQGDAA